MRKNTSGSHSAIIPSDAVVVSIKDDPKAVKALENIRSKYPHAMTDKVWRHEGKIGVLISCEEKGCENERFVHSSDLFQVKRCEEHKRPAKAPKAKAAKAKAAPAKKGSSRKAPKGGKAPRKVRASKAPESSSPASATVA